jgi:hypothetical protein
MAQTTDTQKPNAPRGFKILLGVSLALNLVILGLAAGAAFRGAPPQRGGGGGNYARPYIKALPSEDRQAIFAASRLHKGDKGGRAGGLALYGEVTEALRAEVFDREAVKAVLSKQTEMTLGIQNTAQAYWLDLIEEMGLQERRDYADAVEELVQRRGPPKRKP